MPMSQIVENGSLEEQTKLIEHCKARDMLENIGFMWAVIHYRKFANRAQEPVGNVPIAIVQIGGMIPPEFWGGENIMGKWIYDTFIDLDGKHPINIAGGQKDALTKIAKQQGTPFKPADFDAAYKRISSFLDDQVGAHAGGRAPS